MQWLYLFIASIFEMAWIFSLKTLNFAAIKQISFQSLSRQPFESFLTVLPLFGYICFGLANIYFFSLAMKQLPASTAFAVWMGITLAGVKLIEVFFFKEVAKPMDYVFLVLIAIAIMGLKKS